MSNLNRIFILILIRLEVK